MERDESASYRDTALFRLNFSRAQQLEQDNAYLAYQSYQKALKLCRNSNESIYCDENYITSDVNYNKEAGRISKVWTLMPKSTSNR